MSELGQRSAGAAVYDGDAERALDDRLRSGDVPVAVYGLDRTGITLAATAAATTGNVVAADADPDRVATVAGGELPARNRPALASLLADATAADELAVTASLADAAARAQVHIVGVPTTMADGPDLAPLRETLAAVAEGLDAGDAVVVESTLPVGTSRDELLPLLAAESGLDSDAFGFGFTPERPPGSGLRGLRSDHTRIVAGRDGESERVAATVFEALTGADATRVADLETAEFAGLVTAAARTVSTALSNELARHAADLDVDVSEVLAATAERPDCHLPQPNLGAASCRHPGYVRMLGDELESDTRVLDAARVSNDLMPTHAAITLLEAFESIGLDPADASVLVVGLDHRPAPDGDRGAPAVRLTRSLTEDGVTVDATGPGADRTDADEVGAATIVDVETALEREYDAVAFASPTVEPPDGRTMAALAPADHPLVVLDGHQLLPELRTDDRVIYRGIGINA